MAYLANSTHYNNWIFTPEELSRIDRLRMLKVKKTLRLQHHAIAEAAFKGNSGVEPTRKSRSFAALLSVSSTATRDEFDWNDDIDLDLDIEEENEEKEGLRITPLIEYLTPEQEALVRDFYEAKVQESCTQLFRTSDKVKCCAVMLYKRFYLSNSVMEFHPKFIVPTAIYVAGKVEEQYINVDTIAEQLQVDHKHVIGHEMILLEGVRFQLIMYHPLRALHGFVDDYRGFHKSQGKDLPLDALQKLHANSCVVLNDLMLTRLPLHTFPALLSLASLCHVAEEMEKDPHTGVTHASVLAYIKRSKFSHGKDVEELYRQLSSVVQQYRQFQATVKDREKDPVLSTKHDKDIKKVYKKLKVFHVEDKADSKKRKAENENGDSKKEKKKSKKEKKEKKEKKKV